MYIWQFFQLQLLTATYNRYETLINAHEAVLHPHKGTRTPNSHETTSQTRVELRHGYKGAVCHHKTEPAPGPAATVADTLPGERRFLGCFRVHAF